jgi:hypothetical protein
MSIHVELAQADSAAVDTALATLRARPPARYDRCGGRTFEPQPRDGYWRCTTCFGGTLAPPVPAAEQQAAILRARREAREVVLAPGDAALRRRIAVDQQRDRRALGPLQDARRATLLHRANPSLCAATAATREWREDRLLDLAQKHQLELTGHEDPFALRAQELVPVILFRGLDAWTRTQGYQGTSDFPGLLDNVAHTLFLDAYGDTVRSFEAWTTAITVADFRSTIAGVVDFPDLLAIPEHGEYAAGDPFGAAVPVRLTRHGRVVQFTREAVLRDDVPTFGQLQAALGVAAAHVRRYRYPLTLNDCIIACGALWVLAGHLERACTLLAAVVDRSFVRSPEIWAVYLHYRARVRGRHAAQPDRAVGTRDDQQPTWKLLHEHRVAGVPAARALDPSAEHHGVLEQRRDALAREALGEVHGGLDQEERAGRVVDDVAEPAALGDVPAPVELTG